MGQLSINIFIQEIEFHDVVWKMSTICLGLNVSDLKSQPLIGCTTRVIGTQLNWRCNPLMPLIQIVRDI